MAQALAAMPAVKRGEGGGGGRGECLLLSSSLNCMTGHFVLLLDINYLRLLC